MILVNSNLILECDNIWLFHKEYLSLDDIPGISQPNVVVCVVESKTVFKVLLCILTDLWTEG